MENHSAAQVDYAAELRAARDEIRKFLCDEINANPILVRAVSILFVCLSWMTITTL